MTKPSRHRQSPKREPSGAGRRRTPLRQHPDRYALVRIDAMAWLADSEHKGGMLAVMNMIGIRGVINDDKTLLCFEYPQEVHADLKSLAEKLRQMRRWYRSEDDIKWRTRAAESFLLMHMFSLNPNREKRAWAADMILRCVAEIGETEWANQTLLPALQLNL
jgi:hypothetical protein